jgi:NADPH2:quinone reductase
VTVSASEEQMTASANEKTMKRVVVDHFGGPEVLMVVEDEVPRPGLGEVRVRVLAAGVSFTDAQLRVGTYLGVPKPPFTPGYDLVGIVEELGPGCSRLKVGDRVASLTVWGADAERVCVLEENAVEVPDDLDPAEVVSLVLTYMTAYQLLHRTAKVTRGESVLVHGAAGRVGTAVNELGAVAGLRMYGTCAARDRGAVERLGAVAIDYQSEDFLARVRELPGKGVDVVLDGLGGGLSLRSFRALRPGGRLVVFGHSATLVNGKKSWRGWLEW